ncbi:MAG: hypothetical protein V2A74_07800 [bacterium]
MNKEFFVLSEKALNVIEKALTEMLQDEEIRSALFVDRTGYIIAHRGKLSHKTAEELGVITAGFVACLNSLSSISKSENMSIKFHSNRVENLHFRSVTPRTFLAVFFDPELPDSIVEKLATVFAETVEPALDEEETEGVSFGSLEFIEEKLNELFEDL